MNDDNVTTDPLYRVRAISGGLMVGSYCGHRRDQARETYHRYADREGVTVTGEVINDAGTDDFADDEVVPMGEEEP